MKQSPGNLLEIIPADLLDTLYYIVILPTTHDDQKQDIVSNLVRLHVSQCVCASVCVSLYICADTETTDHKLK